VASCGGGLADGLLENILLFLMLMIGGTRIN